MSSRNRKLLSVPYDLAAVAENAARVRWARIPAKVGFTCSRARVLGVSTRISGQAEFFQDLSSS